MLQDRGWQVEALDNLSTGDAANVPLGVKLHVGDIQSDSDIRAVMRAAAFDAVVHCAAQTSVERSMKDPELDHAVNVLGTRSLAAAARQAGVGRFVFLSSGGAIYGETDEPADERAPLVPLNCYGLNKLMAENEVQEAGISYCILRLSNVYGPGQRSDPEGGVVAIFRERLLCGKPLEIHCGGEQVRDFVYVTDVAAAVVAAAPPARVSSLLRDSRRDSLRDRREREAQPIDEWERRAPEAGGQERGGAQKRAAHIACAPGVVTDL